MKTLLLLLLFIGAFLIMDGAHRDTVKAAVAEAEARGRGETRYRVADGNEILDLQFAPRSNQFGSIFDSNGPWAFRGAAEPFSIAKPKSKRVAEPEMKSGTKGMEHGGGGRGGASVRMSSTEAPVEGFSGAGGGRPSFLDGLGDPRHYAVRNGAGLKGAVRNGAGLKGAVRNGAGQKGRKDKESQNPNS